MGQHFSTQEILKRCFNSATGRLTVTNTYDIQDYFNAIFDAENNSLRIAVDGVVTGETPSGDVLPEVTAEDNYKVLTVINGAWAKVFPTTELPIVTVDDNDKILTVVNGVWAKADAPSSGTTYTAGDGIAITNETISLDVTGATTGQVLKKTELGIGWVNDETGTAELPAVTVSDNDKILTVINGAWASGTAPVGVTTASVQSALSIDTSTGSLSKVLSEKGTFVDLPEAGTGEVGSSDVTALQADRKSVV